MVVKLTIELVPRTAWGSNVSTLLKRSQWDKVRRAVYAQAQHRCEICGGKGSRHPVECHERWEYDDTRLIQRLVGMIALCPQCHSVKHIGRALSLGFFGDAVAHLARVNGWKLKKAERYAFEQLRVWKERSRSEWILDMDHLLLYGIDRDQLPARRRPQARQLKRRGVKRGAKKRAAR